MSRKSCIIGAICIGICLLIVCYCGGYSACENKLALEEDDFNATFSEVESITNVVDSDYICISINSESKQFYIFYFGSRKIIAQGKCSIEDNIVLMNDGEQNNVIVYTTDNYYWIDNDGNKHTVNKINSAAVIP